MRQLFLEGRALHIFPCRADKKPCTPHGYLDAVSDAPRIAKLWARYPGPLVGVATGAVSGIDVIDIDPRHGGHKWLDANRDRLPATRMHRTPGGGVHAVYRHCPGLRNSVGKIALGVDLKITGGYVIWHPAHDWPVLVFGPVAQFPTWVAAGGMGTTSISKSANGNGSEVVPISFLGAPPTAYEINYAKKALGNAFLELRACSPGGRNAKLNALAYSMGRLIARGWIIRDRVETMLLKGADQCGLLADDGVRQCNATIDSGVRAGMTQPYHDIGQRVA
jgi:hypothetical protein